MQAKQPSREQLLLEIAGLRQKLEALKEEKADLEILLETTTEHSDTVEAELHNKAEEVVKESERRLLQFLEAIPVGILVVDAKGQLYYVNQRAQELAGRTIQPGTQAEQLAEMYQVYRAGTEQLYPIEQLPLVRALKGENATADDIEIHYGEKVTPLEVWGTPIFDEWGKIAYAIAAFQDITERKKAEAERTKFTSELFKLNQALSRFVPCQFLELLDKESIVDVQLGDQVQKKMSVLFSDIRGFTALSENMTTEENFQFINSYLSCMEPAIIENHGFIDKYMGDAIMALFSGSADNAVRAGIVMLKSLTDYNQNRLKLGDVPIRIGIGINTGSLMLGTVGGVSRMDSTVISDTVNLASRLEGLTKEYQVALLISHNTFSQLNEPNQYAFRVIDRVKVKGKSVAVSVYEVFDADPLAIKMGKLATKTLFEQGLLLYNQGDFREAVLFFGNCLHQNPGDTVAQIYWERCQG
ncbi:MULTISPECIES: adenylate/guanylate cyclase domain-containing protein [unclassified Coleofasciculus]|uniref:adenylate/guanylate cyclase domain-containing protein n=1 Tax=unclassified Coleofasciculus TaxID=2692782 RepID=UPI001882DF8D|nr:MULTISPECIES: adenylate/guanylate cyclase domain-containing protein [unclassified Coleofasciculus]MBE9129318.1 PAS domain S-box protein [Coleofasciculus sp. LEGE 07081]MBE9151992.1 PAS domain S-box protein [Coleofasciculus sp. LEGE 07092]